MAYVFGDAIICKDAESAKAITFNTAVAVKTVTAQGDVFDPSGTMSGGSAPSGNGVLLRVQQLNRAESNLAQAQEIIKKLENAGSNTDHARSQWAALKHDLEIKAHELTLLEKQVGGSNASRVRILSDRPLGSLSQGGCDSDWR